MYCFDDESGQADRKGGWEVNQYYHLEHKDGSSTFIKAKDKTEAKRKYVQLGFPLDDVIRCTKVEDEENAE